MPVPWWYFLNFPFPVWVVLTLLSSMTVWVCSPIIPNWMGCILYIVRDYIIICLLFWCRISFYSTFRIVIISGNITPHLWHYHITFLGCVMLYNVCASDYTIPDTHLFRIFVINLITYLLLPPQSFIPYIPHIGNGCYSCCLWFSNSSNT